jgi:glycosyltransferase involved in cell wall biosynthesis
MIDTTLLETAQPGILCLSHLGWDYVWQRPQHVLSRFAEHYPVVYVREPTLTQRKIPRPTIRLVSEEGGLTAWEILFPDGEETLRHWRDFYVRLVQDLLVDEGWARWVEGRWVATRPIILWFYTATPYYFFDHITPAIVVYDVMDDLDSFKGGPEDMREREARVLSEADVVFTGGVSLYEARRDRHPNVHLFRSGVEVDHFAQALEPSTEIAPEVAGRPHPVLGYYGVIDERIDLDLLRELAAARPEWSIVMVGPVTKIEREELPQAPNLHYVSRQPYDRLPEFLKGFDVAIMPFALNGATRYISPTKTLEYMAAHKPVLSTSVPDVVSNWGDVVRIADDVDGWVRAVDEALNESEEKRQQRIWRAEKHLVCCTWDAIAREMRSHVEAALGDFFDGLELVEEVEGEPIAGWPMYATDLPATEQAG